MFKGEFFSLDLEEIKDCERVYPGVNVWVELHKMDKWLKVNPERRKKRYERFVVNWLAKAHSDLLRAEVAVMVREDIRRSRVPI
jgi:hypothetical protein